MLTGRDVVNRVFRLCKTLIWLLVAYKWADWRNYKKYYPTLLFMSLGDLLYNFTFYNFPLWELFDPILNVTFTTLLFDLITFPASILLYLSLFPKNNGFKKVTYILKWIALFTFLEWITLQFSLVRYSNGWNLWWSIAFNTFMFPALKIHYDKPLLAWLFMLIVGSIIAYYFKLPLGSMK